MLVEFALNRFEEVMGRRHRALLDQLRPGLDDAGLDRLREAVAPYRVPVHVEALYRWRDGGAPGLFGGCRMLPVDELIERYRFTCEDLESPRTWLPVFDDQIINVVTLDVLGLPPSDPSVWFGHTHDGFLWRLFNSIPALLDVVCDAEEDGALIEMQGGLGLAQGDFVESLDGFGWSTYRLRRSPTAYRHPDPPSGTDLPRWPSPDWPQQWLVPLASSEDSFRL